MELVNLEVPLTRMPALVNLEEVPLTKMPALENLEAPLTKMTRNYTGINPKCSM